MLSSIRLASRLTPALSRPVAALSLPKSPFVVQQSALSVRLLHSGGYGSGRRSFRLPPSWPVWAIIGANVGVTAYYYTVVLQGTSREQYKFDRRWALSRTRFADDKLALVRSMFLHVSPMHLLFNMFTLHSFGISMAHMIGPSRFLALYFTAGAVGGFCQLYYERIARALGFPAAQADLRIMYGDPASIGASGAIFGVVGAMAAMFPHNEIALFFIPMPNWAFLVLVGGGSAYLAWAGDTAFNGSVADSAPRLGHFAHLGGLITGVAASRLLRRRLYRY